jgi:hypothetical protein
MNTAPAIAVGRYRHFKGREYEVLGLARHSETQEWLVVYRPCYAEGWWVRPAVMFLEFVDHDGARVPRFAHIA